MIKCARKGLVKAGMKIVCVITGHGLKDPDQATLRHRLTAAIEPDLGTVVKAIGL